MTWDAIPSDEAVKKAAEAVKDRAIRVITVDKRTDALHKLEEIIPGDAEVMTASSTTLQEIGFIDLLKSGKHPWRNLKEELLSETDPLKQLELRQKSVTAQYFLGSVHAVAQTGEIVVASASGSQVPAYAYSSPNVIWVIGVQKIVPTLKEAITRVREYVLPLEDARMKREGFPGSMIGKLLILEREMFPGRITAVFVRENLGF